MARGRKQIQEHIIREMFILHSDGMSANEIGERLNKAPNTVLKYLKDETYIAQYGELLQEIEQIHKKSNETIIELVKSTRYSDIANNIVDIFTKANLEEERESNGIRNLISLLGNTIDKTIALKRLDIQDKQLELQVRTLELKEKELEARIENPDAFATVQIINDAPQKETPYGTN